MMIRAHYAGSGGFYAISASHPDGLYEEIARIQRAHDMAQTPAAAPEMYAEMMARYEHVRRDA